MSDFQKKLPRLPQKIREYLTCQKGVDINVSIYDKHGLEPDQMGKLTDLITHVYFKEISLSEFEKRVKREFGLPKDKAEALLKDLLGAKLLIIDDWLDEDVEASIKNLGADPGEYQTYIKDIQEAVASEKKQEKEDKQKQEKEEEEGSEDQEKSKKTAKVEADNSDDQAGSALAVNVDPEKEKKESLEVFKSSLVYLLDIKEQEILKDYNLILIRLFVDDSKGDFKKGLEKSLFANEEKLTTKEFLLGEEKKRPTVANWLKHFIKTYGSDMFSNMELSEFLTNSVNTKALDEKEKERVKKLLILYRNVKFFFEFFQDKPVDTWQIFPVSEENKTPLKKENLSEATPKEKEPASSEKEISDPRIDELEKQKEEYPQGSLERMAIEEEIKKIKESLKN